VRLDLDHSFAVIGEQSTGCRSGCDGAEIEDDHTLQRGGGLVLCGQLQLSGLCSAVIAHPGFALCYQFNPRPG